MKPEDIPRSELLELYKVAIDEYRFEVRLNWDRMQYYLVFNTAILSAGLGLFKLPGDRSATPLLGLVFVFGVLVSLLGAHATNRGHQYYRRARVKKTLTENLLDLHHSIGGYTHPNANLSVTTTEGMSETIRILQDDEWRRITKPLGRWDIVWCVVMILRGFAVINAALAVYMLSSFFVPAPRYTGPVA